MEGKRGPEDAGPHAPLELQTRGRAPREPRHHGYQLPLRPAGRLDCRPTEDRIFKNSSFVYTTLYDRGILDPISHRFSAAKKFPFKYRRKAFDPAPGFVRESSSPSSGPRAAESTGSETTIILRLNIEC